MEETIYLYPGTFCPPTEGHRQIAEKMAKICQELNIICSVNTDKGGGNIFTPEECKGLWGYYNLPQNVRVYTLDEFLKRKIDFRKVVMVRGVRGDRDFDYEKKVMMKNLKELKIDKFMVVMSEEEFKNVSSTLARELAAQGDMDGLCKIVARDVAEKMVAKRNNKQ